MNEETGREEWEGSSALGEEGRVAVAHHLITEQEQKVLWKVPLGWTGEGYAAYKYICCRSLPSPASRPS